MILQPDEPGLQRTIDCIRNGGLVAYPTETVYGLGADPFNPTSLERIFAVKGRDAGKSIILLIPNTEHLNALVSHIPDTGQTLIDTFWPGPLTLVFQARKDLPQHMLGPGNTIALRISDAPVTQSLLALLNAPLTSTSANRSGSPPAQSASEALQAFSPDVDLILDGGPSTDTRPSTLVRVSTNQPEILREGRISSQSIHQALGTT
ncbi:MAG: L-threonylcarbamoyladenylate synthase [bacterium]|nr:L-threonylcarbamoyladenylate synthase [bacterium]